MDITDDALTAVDVPTLRMTPNGCLAVEGHARQKLDGALVKAFAQGTGQGLLALCPPGLALPVDLMWWRGYARQFLSALRLRGATAGEGLDWIAEIQPPSDNELLALASTAPLMQGSEYLNAFLLSAMWDDMCEVACTAIAESGLEGFLKSIDPASNLVGKVHFNLAENRKDPDNPFAFMATYVGDVGAHGRAQHLPLGHALRTYAGDREKLLSLLVPVRRASEVCGWVRDLVDSEEIFQPIRWRPSDAALFLDSAEALERCGVMVRMPQAWGARRPPRPKVTAQIGGSVPSKVGLGALLDFSSAMTLEGEPLTEEEMAGLLSGSESLVLLRGKWVEVDRDRLQTAVSRLKEAENLAKERGMTFADAMRMLAGTAGDDDGDPLDSEWVSIQPGPWLDETLRKLRSPDGVGAEPGPGLRATLRPYQKAGVQWLRMLSGLGLGACLADDMGLGKTLQVLALLVSEREQEKERRPSLLVAPASLLSNWVSEAEKFAPDLAVRILHPSEMTSEEVKAFGKTEAAGLDLVVTSYGTLLRVPNLTHVAWRHVILDEAQAIKNAGSKQAKAVKSLQAASRIALTGTPVENRLGDLWSLFDFINPGLLGNAKDFSRYTKKLNKEAANPYAPLRRLVQPYLLRRMKTDKSIISDLPDKTEVRAFCHLSRRQAALYEQAVAELEAQLKLNVQDDTGMKRRGAVLSAIMRLKQICNHSAHWLRDGAWLEEDSGKLQRLREIAETVASRQEKMLVFTQFQEATEPLSDFLEGIFGRKGLVLRGDTPIGKRRDFVKRFQSEDGEPYFVLSLKAGGSGLTLTAASHVVHFDRWWNPAVENQATDRAFRIGQKRNVLVHKMVCRGTVEERIDSMIEAKQGLSDALLGGGEEVNLTEMSDEALLDTLRLDLASALREG